MWRRTYDWLRFEEIVNHRLKCRTAIFPGVCHQILQYQPSWKTFVAVLITQTLQIMALTTSDVDHEDLILQARTLHKTFLYGVVVEPARFPNSASSHIRVKTLERHRILLHPVEK